MQQVLKSIVHSGKYSVREKLILALLSRSNEPSSLDDLRSALEEVGISRGSLRNISQTMNKSPEFIRTPSGWELSPSEYERALERFAEFNEHAPQEAAKVISAADTRPVVFFGHGRSEVWRVLKDYVVNQLGCDYEEYNREPTPGLSRKERLVSMLERADFALLIMTAEDQQEDGTWRARENVVHEVGLFQGRLSFERAIVVLENGCNEFTNIAGLDQIRYADNIMNIAHQVRDVLVREDLIFS